MRTEQKIKAVIYARVSSREQEETGYSLESQEKLLKDYSEQKDFDLVKIYKVTESASGKQVRRTFNEMIQFVVKNDIDVIVCEKIDRLTRNLKDAATASDWILEGDDRQIHFVKENFVVSKHTKAHENLVWDMKVAIARFYTNNLSEEVRKGQKEKTSQGWLPTKPPLGYKTIGEKGHKIHVIDEEVAPYIRKMFELYASGNYSTPALGKKMHELGFRSRAGGRVVKSKIHKLLSDPFYYGKFIWKGVEHQGKHEPIISRDLFEQVKAKMTRPSAPYHNKHYKELRGKIFCGNCHKTVTWERQKGHWYGACKQCKAQLAEDKKYIRQEDVEARLMAKIEVVAPQNERVLEVLRKALKESHSEEIAYHDAQVKGINGSLERIQQRKRAMYDDKLDGRISADFYDEKLKSFKQEEELLTENLKKLKSDNTEYYKVGFSIHELALRAGAIYRSQKASIEERRALLAYAYETVSVVGGVVTPVYTKGFSFLAEWMPTINKVLEPMQKTAETLVSSGDLHSLESDFSLGLSELRDDSRTSKKSPVKPRQRQSIPLSRPLLRW
ncbi:MAG TPA: recombinase family protein [Candidatus Paceibacterota bacterium]|nr:recombinase family protein [Candidatus Paceibacterota bacterium]